jgi:hypothetical protein
MMGRLDAIIDDSLEQNFRIEVVKRMGGRKGDISKALEEAMDLWIRNNVIENLKEATLHEKSDVVKGDNIRTMKGQGKAAVHALSELLKSDKISGQQKITINGIIRDFSKEKTSPSVL